MVFLPANTTHGAKISIILVKTQHHLITEQTMWINPQPSYISSYSQTHSWTIITPTPTEYPKGVLQYARRSCDEDFQFETALWEEVLEFRKESEFPQNSEVSTTQINTLKSSYQAASWILVTSMTQLNKIMHVWSDGHNVWRLTKRGSIQPCILIHVKMEKTFYFSLYVVVLNEKDILFWILQYYSMWPDRPQYMDIQSLKNIL